MEVPLHLPGGGAGHLPRGHRRGAIEELQGEMPHQPDKLQAHPLDLGTHRLPHRGRGHLRHLPGPGTRRLPHPGREHRLHRPDPGTHRLLHPGREPPRALQVQERTTRPIPVGAPPRRPDLECPPAPSRSGAPLRRPDREMHHLPHPGQGRHRILTRGT